MDDLVFKVIPAEGFDHQGEDDRISNPTPTRKGKQPAEEQVPVQVQSPAEVPAPAADEPPVIPKPVLPLRLENADVSETAAAAARFSDLPGLSVGRASCPTPTRRDAAPQRPDTGQPVFQDPNARLSNPTPTRRRGALQPAASSAPVQPAAPAPAPAPAVPRSVDTRASNPTPTRRRASAPAPVEPSGTAPDETGSRYSNPTPTFRR